MAVPFGQTFGVIKLEVARASGDLERTGTATGGSTTTIVDTALIDATDTALKGRNVYAYDGAGQSQEPRSTAFTPGTDTITVPTQTTAFASGTKYIVTRRFTQSDILSAIRRALWGLGRYAKPYVDQSLIAGSPLVNATFYDGSGTFPNGWTQGGTGGAFTRESTISKHGRYACKIVSDGTNAASVTQDVANIALYRGKSITLRGWLNSNTTGSRAYMLVDDGIDTTTGIFNITTANRGWGTQEEATAALTVSDRASRLRVTLGITSGAAVTAYFSAPYITGLDWREWAIPAGSPTAIERIRHEDTKEGVFGPTLYYPDTFGIVRETTRRLRLKATVPQGLILAIEGRTSWADHATAASDDDTTFDGDPAWLIAEAAYLLLLTKPREEDARLVAQLKAEADARRPAMVGLPPSACPIEF